MTSAAPNLPHCRRESAREFIGKSSTVRTHDARPIDVTIGDMSSAGFSFTSEQKIPIGGTFYVGLVGGGRASAIVAWQEGERHGCLFRRQLTPAQFESAFTQWAKGSTVVSINMFQERVEAKIVPNTSRGMPVLARVIIIALSVSVGWGVLATVLRSLPL